MSPKSRLPPVLNTKNNRKIHKGIVKIVSMRTGISFLLHQGAIRTRGGDPTDAIVA